jgi:hypothetical protein
MRRLTALFSPKCRKNVSKDTKPALQRQVSVNNEALIGQEFATLGVSLAFLNSLSVSPDASFEVVRDEVVKMTVKTKGNRSLASHLMQDPKTKHLVGKADYFVSYAWSGGFGATMNALTKHFEGKASPFVWMDIAMVDQHAAANTDVDFSMWSHTFKESLKRIGHALLVLSPGEKPIAISRSWCCFEWVCIKQAGIPFEYCVNPDDVEKLIEFMESGMGYTDFNNIFADINVEKARAFKSSDQEAILQLMREIGVKEVNDVVMLSVKHWLLSAASQSEKRVKQGTKEGVFLLNAKACLHQALVSFPTAPP